MALVVDSGGRMIANPKSGRIMNQGTSAQKLARGGASALVDALNASDVPATPAPAKKTGANALRESLERAASNAMPSLSPTTRLSRQAVSTSVPSVDATSTVPSSSPLDAALPTSLSPSEGRSPRRQYQTTTASAPEGMASYDSSVRGTLGVGLPSSGYATWEQGRADEEGRDVRTQNYWGEDYDKPSTDVLANALDRQTALIGNTAWNDAYVRDALQNGADEDTMYDVMHRDWSQPQAFYGMGDLMAIDDGSSYDYDHMTADTMTGTQYLHYAKLGMGGRPTSEIDPTQTYSKRREQVNYDFIPFTPDVLSYVNMVVDNAADAPARVGSAIAGIRESVGNDLLGTPYQIGINGKTINGREFDRIGGAYINQMVRDIQYDPGRFLQPIDDAEPTILEFPVTDLDGNVTYHYGHLTGVGDYGDGTYALDFSDGTTVEVGGDFYASIDNGDGTVSMRDSRLVTPQTARGELPDLTTMNDVDALMKTGDPLANADVVWYPDLVMSDGTRLTFDEAQDIYYDHEVEDNPDNAYDDGITYDFSSFGPFDNRPARLNQELFGEDGGTSTFANNVMDWTLGSIPISVGGPLAWASSLSNASSSLQGLDPATYDVANDSTGLAGGFYDENGSLRYGVRQPDGSYDQVGDADKARFWNTLGNAAVPLTEEIVGPIGEEGIPLRKGLGRLFNRSFELPDNPTVREVLGDLALGMFEEGIEEDLGNVFDDMTSYGVSGMFADQATDEGGNPLYDLTGHEVRDETTPALTRLRNFADADDLANAWAGGALVDLAMQANPLMRGNVWGNLGRANDARRIRQELGLERLAQPVRTDAVQVPQSFLDRFDDTRQEK